MRKGGHIWSAQVQMYHTHDLWCIAICIATWSLNTHQIWSQSAQSFQSYNLTANFDTLYAARATCQDDPPPPSSQKRAKSYCNQLANERASAASNASSYVV